MYVIVDILGKQFMLKKGDIVHVPKLFGDIGSSILFNNILFSLKNNDLKIGFPLLKNIEVSAKILSQVKSDKVIVFKKKRRKGYKKLKGHRQNYTKIFIENIYNI